MNTERRNKNAKYNSFITSEIYRAWCTARHLTGSTSVRFLRFFSFIFRINEQKSHMFAICERYQWLILKNVLYQLRIWVGLWRGKWVCLERWDQSVSSAVQNNYFQLLTALFALTEADLKINQSAYKFCSLFAFIRKNSV